MANVNFVPNSRGYDIIKTGKEVCHLLESVGEKMADKCNAAASDKRGDTPYFATKASTTNGHAAIVFVENSDNHGYWDNQKHHTLNKVRRGGKYL